MPSIEARLKDVLDETRLMMLGTQLLMGLQYNAAFAQEFSSLPLAYRWLDGLALLFILTAAAFLLSVPSYHQIADHGHATGRILRRASIQLKIAFLPLSLALGADVSIAYIGAAGPWVAPLGGASFVVAALGIWYILPLHAGIRGREEVIDDKEQSLETRIEQALTEIRVVLPGAQALFGFQFAAVLTATFSRLPVILKDIHLVSFSVVAVAIMMLIAPAAYHRIACSGKADERVLRYAVRMMLPAQGLIAVGLIGEAYITTRTIFQSQLLAASIAVVAFGMFAILLYLTPFLARRRSRANLSAATKAS
jgi:hypothetical protein